MDYRENDTRKLGYYCVYSVVETLNGWAVIDIVGRNPTTPIYYVPYSGSYGHGKEIANAILLILISDGNNDSKLEKYEQYKYKKDDNSNRF